MTKTDKQVMLFVQECLNDEKLHHITIGSLSKLIHHVETILNVEFPKDLDELTDEQIKVKFTI